MHADVSTPTQDSSEQSSSNKCGVIGLILSITGVLLCGLWLLTIPGLIISLIGLRKEPKTAAITGSILGGIGVLEFLILGPLMLGLLLPAFATAMVNAQNRVTHAKIQGIQLMSDTYFDDNQKYPNSLDELKQGNYIDDELTTDAWDHQVKFEGGGDTRPVITSSGRDGEFGTDDDISEKQNDF